MTTIKAVFSAVAYAGGLLRSGRVAVHTAAREIYFGLTDKDTVRFVTSADDTGWQPVTLLSGWEEYDEPVAYRVDAAGVLHLKGTVRYGPLNYPVLQLPVGARPSRNVRKTVPMRDGIGLIDINLDGYVIPRGEEEQEYDDNGDPTGNIVEVGYLSLETGVML